MELYAVGCRPTRLPLRFVLERGEKQIGDGVSYGFAILTGYLKKGAPVGDGLDRGPPHD